MRPILFFTLLLLTLKGFTQGHQNTLDENKVWSVYYRLYTSSATWWTYHYKFLGDTSLNGFVYKEVNRARDQNSNNWIPLPYNFIREDSLKVYIFNSYNGLESVLYDYSLKAGDSITRYDHTWIVSKVDSVYFNGNFRERIILAAYPECSHCLTDTWIKGYGSLTFGIWDPLTIPTNGSTKLLCIKEDTGLIYQDSLFKTCWTCNDPYSTLCPQG